jgi:hypothetical protein
MKKPKFSLSIDNLFNAILTMECEECKQKNKFPMPQISPNKIIKCKCGIEYLPDEDDIKKLQEELVNFKRIIKNLNK